MVLGEESRVWNAYATQRVKEMRKMIAIGSAGVLYSILLDNYCFHYQIFLVALISNV